MDCDRGHCPPIFDVSKIAWPTLHTPDAQPLPATAWVEYGTRDTTARHGYDYTGIVRTVELPAGTPPGTVVTVTIELRDDDVDENDEVFEDQAPAGLGRGGTGALGHADAQRTLRVAGGQGRRDRAVHGQRL
ncbi:MAG TPA: Calx-beta domain-containing protein, partial [Vicinamibacteria bacterium]|nr:Calx-beta domain-containing protein [Vicinamibacteria bacterium]